MHIVNVVPRSMDVTYADIPKSFILYPRKSDSKSALEKCLHEADDEHIVYICTMLIFSSQSDAGQLDKFKRRLIRSVAWMLIHQKMPEADVWKEMKKVMGCDCKQLWEHMKSLTQKKLRRLLVAKDKVVCIPEIARMSLTDWQLYDQVLVHEDLDVIGLHTMNPYKPDNKVLIDLFALVQRFDIEVKSGDELADAWSAATVYYNSQGHQCSPMLLQKRWHQLKAETRRRFYEYWHSYRGNEKQMPKAEQYRPTVLQRTMARRFPEIITAKFPDWEASIEQNLVILPDDFETRKNIKVLSKPIDENSPDLLVMEQHVETVDLLQESDTEEENSQEESPETNNDNDESDPVPAVTIKVEPEDPEIAYTANEKSNKTDLAMAHTVEQETLFDNIDVDDDDIVEMTAEEHNIITIPSDFESEVASDDNGTDKQDNAVTEQEFIPKITNIFGNINMTDETLSILDNLTRNTPWPPERPKSIEVENVDQETNNDEKVSDGPVCLRVDIMDSNDESDAEVELINENALKETALHADISPVIINTVSLNPDAHTGAVLSKITEKTATPVSNTNNDADNRKLQFGSIDLSSFGEISEDMNFADDGIELVEDEVTDPSKDDTKKKDVNHNKDVTNTKRKTSINEHQEFNLDKKLFLDPVVYTMKLDDMCFLKDKNIDTINVKMLLNKIIFESKPISDRSVDAEKARIDRRRISLSNSMLQKPKNRTYNPIQLCKNPDFNTRLKRLTAGFLSSWQNRTLLKACKPVTIDLTKAFESKLINNTIYLKKPDYNQIIEIDEDESKSTSVFPSVIPVQTLIDNTKLDDVLKLKSAYSSDSLYLQGTDTVIERNKVINLPDITQVRRINQTLLTAEVTPIQIQNTDNVSKSDDVNIKSTPTGMSTNIDISNAQVSNPDVNKEGVVQNTGETASVSSTLVKTIAAPVQSPVLKNPIQSVSNNKSQSSSIDPKKDKNQKKPATGPVKSIPWRPSMPSWLKKIPQPGSKHDDFLLTIDTLHKMLFVFNGKKKNQLTAKQKKKFKKKIEKKKETKPPPKEPAPKPKEVKQTVKERANKKEPRVLTKVVYRSAYCCWSREQIAYFSTETNKRRRIHDCLKNDPDACKCCCKEELEKIIAVAKIGPEAAVPLLTLMVPHEKIQKDTMEIVVPGKTSLQNNDVPAIASVYTLNSAVENKLSLNPDLIVSSQNLINDVVQQSLTISHKPDDETVELNIPIYDDTQLIKPIAKPKNITPTKNNFELKMPYYEINRVAKSLVNPVATLDISGADTQKLDIPIYDETQINNVAIRPLTNSASAATATKKLNIPIHDETKLIKPINPDVVKCKEVVDVSIKNSNKSKPLTETLNGPKKLGNVDKSLKKCTCPLKILNKIKQITKLTEKADETHKSLKQNNDDEVKITSVSNDKDKVLVLILNSKQMMKVPSGCPIFLGANKILLTDIEFPRSIQELSQNQSILNSPQSATPPLPLPFGVQLVQLQNGQLTYITKPGIELSPENKAKMTGLLDMIQMQINSTGTTFMTAGTTPGNISIGNEIVDISDDETSAIVNDVNLTSAAISDNQNNEKINQLNSSLEQIEISQTILEDIPIDEKRRNDPNLQVKTTATQFPDEDDVLNDCNSVVEQHSEKSTENASMTSSDSDPPIVTQTVIDIVVNTEGEKPVTANRDVSNKLSLMSKKTILSDLMEMSGISPEDTVPVQASPTKDEVISKLNSYISIPSSSTPLPGNATQFTHELSPISSFAELKYACHNNGRFYKLDFETGLVVPINVCLKKKSLPPPANVIPIAPKETIDLTEDMEISPPKENNAKENNTMENNAKENNAIENNAKENNAKENITIENNAKENNTIENNAQEKPITKINPTKGPLIKLQKSKMHNVRPVTMFRTLKRPRVVKNTDNQTLPSNLQIIKTPIGRSREVRLAYIPVKQNMEKKPQPIILKRKSPKPPINLSLSESSDDEPLIKKVRRKQNQETEAKSDFVYDFNKEYQKNPIVVRKLTKGPEDDPTALAENDIKLFEDPPDKGLVLEKNSVINCAPNQDDTTGGEDCILGV